MRAFGGFVATLLAAGLIGAALAYPAFEAASHLGPWPFHRVAGRVAMLILALGLVWLFRTLRIRTKQDFGYGVPWPRFLKVSLLWGVLGTDDSFEPEARKIRTVAK